MNDELDRHRGLELENLEFEAKSPADAVVKPAKLAARDVALHVAWIEVVGDVENFDADAPFKLSAAEWDAHLLHYLHVQREEVWITSRFVSSTDVVLVFIDEREGESAAPINYGQRRDTKGQPNLSPQEQSVRRVERQTPALVGSDHRRAQVSEEQAEVVQISDGARADIGEVEVSVLLPAILRHNL